MAGLMSRMNRDYSVDRGSCWEWPQQIDPELAARRARAKIIALAESQFAVPGARFQIDRNQVPDLDPLELWSYLVKEFGGGRSAAVAFHPVAKAFVAALRIDPGDALKFIGGRMSFKRWVVYEGYSGMRYDSCNVLQTILQAFLTISSWSAPWTSDEVGQVEALIKEVGELRYGSRVIRERKTIGNHVLIVPCLTSWEFRLSPEFGEQVQLFLTEFDGFSKAKS